MHAWVRVLRFVALQQSMENTFYTNNFEGLCQALWDVTDEGKILWASDRVIYA